MKKLLLPILVSLMFVLPTQVLANVNFTLDEDSLVTENSFTVTVDTQTDKLDTLDFSIAYTDGIEITSVKDNSAICSTLRSTSQNNVLNIVCTLSEATSINGVVATVTFDKTVSQYSFSLLDNGSLNIGELSLGEIVNIDNEVLAETDDTTTTTEEALPSGEDTVTQEATTEVTDTTTIGTTETTTESTTSKTITDYLPWILLGGAAILLISIIAIIFSGKKEKKEKTTEVKVEDKPETTKAVEEPDNQTISEKAISDNPPTDIDNISNTLYTPQLNTEAIEEKKNNPPVETPMAAVEEETPVDTPTEESTPTNTDMNTTLDTPITPLTQPDVPQMEDLNTPLPTMETPIPSVTPTVDGFSNPNMNANATAPVSEVVSPVATLQGDNVPTDVNADLAALSQAIPTSEPAPVVNNSPMQENNLSSFNTTEPAKPEIPAGGTIDTLTPNTTPEETVAAPVIDTPVPTPTDTIPTVEDLSSAPVDMPTPIVAPTQPEVPVDYLNAAPDTTATDADVSMPDIPPAL